MCLAIPSKVIEIDEEKNSAKVDTMGVVRQASLDICPDEVKIGDFVLLHIGYVMNVIDEKDALESLKIYEEILAQMDKEEAETAKRCVS